MCLANQMKNETSPDCPQRCSRMVFTFTKLLFFGFAKSVHSNAITELSFSFSLGKLPPTKTFIHKPHTFYH